MARRTMWDLIGGAGLMVAGLGILAILVGCVLTALLLVFDFDPGDDLGMKFIAGGAGLIALSVLPIVVAFTMAVGH